MHVMKSYMALLLAVLTVIAYPVASWLLGHDPTKYTIDALTLGVGVTIMWSWGSAAIQAITNGVQKPSSKIILTIWLSWTVLVVQRVYVLLFTLYGKPDSWNESPVSGMITCMLFIAGMYAVIAPTQHDDLTPPARRTSMALAYILGGLVTGLALGFYLATHASQGLTSLIGG